MAVPLITLTSDLGTRDFYIPLVKAYLLSRLPDANIIDISHQISPFNIADAAFIVKSCYREFPKGSIHIVSVDTDMKQKPGFVMVKAAGHYFITFDNGLISLIVEEEEIEEVILLEWDEGQLLFPMRNILCVKACDMILNKGQLKGEAGPYRRLTFLRPMIEEDMIRGTVVYIDNYGNAITNISTDDVEKAARGRRFKIYLRRNEYIDSVSLHYNTVPDGEKLCVAGTTRLLEIAINKGNASKLLGLHMGHGILIEFE